MFKVRVYCGKDNTQWRSDGPLSNPTLPPIKKSPFSFSLGPKINESLENIEKLVDFFNYFIDSQMKKKIVEYTNMRIENDNDKVNECEITAFIGILLLLGVTKKHDIEVSEIWSYDSPHYMWLATAPMSRDRY